MKKKFYLIFIFSFFSLSLFTTSFAFAQPAAPDQVLDGLGTSASVADITQTEGSLSSFIGGVINFSFGAIAAIFVTVIMIGGYLWMAARGNEEKVGKAKIFITNGVFGLMVVFLAYGLVFVILFALSNALGNVE